MKKKNYPLVSIIIDNWNGKRFLKKCLGSVFSQKYPNYEVILIDDASTDNSVEYIKKYFNRVILIENKKHVGFAIANNQGIRKSKGKYVLLLNNDTKVTKNFLFPLVEDLEKNKTIGAAQSKIKVLDNPEYLDDVATYLTPFGFLYHFGFFEKDTDKFNKQFFTFSPKGACFFIRKKVLKEVGLFDDRFYCYFEESDLAWRIWLAGYKIIYEPKSVIYHVVAGTMKKQTSANRDYYAIRNRLNSILSNLSTPFLFIVLPLHLGAIFVFLFFYFLRLRMSNFFAVLKALMWNFFQIKRTLKKRKWVQKKVRNVSDIELFKKIFMIPSPSYYLRMFFLYQKAYERKTNL